MMIRNVMLLLFVLCAVTILEAQERDSVSYGGVGAGPQLGYFRAGDADEGGIMYGAFIRARFSELIGADLSINYRQEQYATGRVEVSQWPVLLSGLIYPIPAVYGIIGVGMYFSSMTFDSQSTIDLPDETSSDFGFHFGAGLELELSRKVKLVGDIKYILLGYGFENFDEIKASDFSANFYVINVGLLFGL